MNKLRTGRVIWNGDKVVDMEFEYEEMGKLGYKKVRAKDVEALNLEGLKIKKSKLDSFKKK